MLSPVFAPGLEARRRAERCAVLSVGQAVEVVDHRLGVSREGVLAEQDLKFLPTARVVVRFKMMGRQDLVEYGLADFERFEILRG